MIFHHYFQALRLSAEVESVLAKFQALGLSDDEIKAALDLAVKHARVGALSVDQELHNAWLKIIAKGNVDILDLQALRMRGIEIRLRPETLERMRPPQWHRPCPCSPAPMPKPDTRSGGFFNAQEGE